MVDVEGSSYCSSHCSSCFSAHCKDTICHLVKCDCSLRMHECKLEEHKQEICTETEVGCALSSIGCPLRMRRRELKKHISVCPAFTIVCNMQRIRLYGSKINEVSNLNPRLSDQIHFSSYIHDIALMWRLGEKTTQIDNELNKNPYKEEIEFLIQSMEGCVCKSIPVGGFHQIHSSDSEVAVTCGHVLRREEVTEHRISHLCLTQQLRSIACPMQSYGCTYKPQAIELAADRVVCRFDAYVCGLVVDWEPVTSFEVDYDLISYLPHNVMSIILDSLDCLSLRNLSAVSKRMREFCFERLYRKGIVTAEWEVDNQGKWFLGRKMWSFSKGGKFPAYRLYTQSSRDISAHLEKCRYYEKGKVNYSSLPDKVRLPITPAEQSL